MWKLRSGGVGHTVLGRQEQATSWVPGTLCGKDGQPWGRKKKNKLLFPEVAFGAMPHQAPVMVEAKEPLWVHKFQGRLGTQFCQKHPLNLAHESCVW